MMFKLFKSQKEKVSQPLAAIVTGKLITLDDVQDEIFSHHVMGNGFAIIPSEDQIVSPASGTVTTLFPTKHAIGLTLDNGLDLLIHLGVDTVELDGVPFEVLVHLHERVETGKPIATMNFKQVENMGKTTECIVVCTNENKMDELNITASGNVLAGENIGTIKNK